MKLPDQYKSIVGERGVKLSGDEKQRIAIARVLLKNSQIVLLDEATLSVDSSTEEQIQGAFRKLAHRLFTIMDADLILVVDHGEIIERGKHNELSQSGKYFGLWTKQTVNA